MISVKDFLQLSFEDQLPHMREAGMDVEFEERRGEDGNIDGTARVTFDNEIDPALEEAMVSVFGTYMSSMVEVTGLHEENPDGTIKPKVVQ